MLSPEAVMRAMANAMHPEIDCSLADLSMIEHVSVEQEKIIVTISLPFPGVPIKDELARIVAEAVANEDDTSQVEVQFATMNEETRNEFMKKAREKWKL